MANVPFLAPTSYVPPQATPAPSPYIPPQQATPAPSPSSNAVEDLIDYLNNAKEIPKIVSPKLKKLLEKIKSIYKQMKLFEFVEIDNALREFTKIYAIKGIEGYDALRFLQGARQNMTKVLRNNRITKVKLLFRCNLEFQIDSEWVVEKHAFHSDIEIILEGTDESDLYDTMAEKVLEALASFQAKKTDSRFHSVIQLELRTAEYKPLKGETYIKLPKELAVKKAIINMFNE